MLKQPRRVKLGDHGLDCRAYKRALKKAGAKDLGRRSRFGERMEHAVKHFQKQHKLKQTGRIGHPTYEKLYPSIDRFGRTLLRAYRMRHVVGTLRGGDVRAAMKAEMDWGLRNERSIHYPPGDVRKEANSVPLEEWKQHHLPITLDCSEAATAVAYRAGAPDPSGSGWGTHGELYTGTMLTHCKHLNGTMALQVGDYVVFGPGTGDHVSVVYEAGRDPLMWSHGSEGGPLLIRLSAQRGMHRTPVTYLSAGIP